MFAYTGFMDLHVIAIVVVAVVVPLIAAVVPVVVAVVVPVVAGALAIVRHFHPDPTFFVEVVLVDGDLFLGKALQLHRTEQ